MRAMAVLALCVAAGEARAHPTATIDNPAVTPEEAWRDHLVGAEDSARPRDPGLDLELAWQPRRWLSLDLHVEVRSSGVAGAPGVSVRHGAGFIGLRARGHAIFDLVAEHDVGETAALGVTVEVREDVHFTPGAPLTALVTLSRRL